MGHVSNTDQPSPYMYIESSNGNSRTSSSRSSNQKPVYDAEPISTHSTNSNPHFQRERCTNFDNPEPTPENFISSPKTSSWISNPYLCSPIQSNSSMSDPSSPNAPYDPRTFNPNYKLYDDFPHGFALIRFSPDELPTILFEDTPQFMKYESLRL